MAKINTQPPRGTRDFFPEDLRLRTWLFDIWRETARRFGFEEVDAPILEHAELYMRKAGEEIVDQLYHFELHDRHLALRSEFTPSLARMVMARQGALRWPIRWFGIPQCWRYERMTRGRRREHYQWNMDVWGEPGVAAEAELINAAFSAMDAMGLGAGDVRMRVNSRALLEETLRERFLGDRPEAFEPLCVVIDKLDKIGADAVVDQLADPDGAIRLPKPDALDVVALLQVGGLEEARKSAPAGSAALADLERLFALLEAYDIADRVVFDASVVRGLAYYTGIVFEAFDTGGKLRAVCGGGRYDRLIESLGGKPVSAVGFGFGDAVIAELLDEKGLLPELPRTLDAVIFPFGDAERPRAQALASSLRRSGQSVELVLGQMKPKRALADADRAGAERIYLIGPDELSRGVARVRELRTGEERDEPLPEGPA
ncbi:MAG: histidine--tRNA ligase [Deltaproteobacteria bacterium]|nr:histidine--tRNA ligase [Deltaproteobacteria bacterium]MBW2394809.1 histidine--tRNA ligase [Deltaproteobacteria bacterium]